MNDGKEMEKTGNTRYKNKHYYIGKKLNNKLLLVHFSTQRSEHN